MGADPRPRSGPGGPEEAGAGVVQRCGEGGAVGLQRCGGFPTQTVRLERPTSPRAVLRPGRYVQVAGRPKNSWRKGASYQLPCACSRGSYPTRLTGMVAGTPLIFML